MINGGPQVVLHADMLRGIRPFRQFAEPGLRFGLDLDSASLDSGARLVQV
jgi:hypothetical protein